MAAPYISTVDAAARLSNRWSITATLTDAELELASDQIDASGPFVGGRYADAQERAFPRSETLLGDTEGAVPERVLDAVALLAYEEQQEETQPAAVRSEGVLDQTIQYASPVLPKSRRRIEGLIAPYLRKTGARL